MNVLHATDRVVLFGGDSKDLDLPPNSVDALVTDPPAGIAFMGKAWDGDKGGRDLWIAWLAGILRRAYVAMKPGAHGLVWALPRTSHWTALAIEAAGFEIRDRVSHLFGTGFPKSVTSKSAEIPEWAGTALKPACEDWWLIRKPLEGTIAKNHAQHGTGVINIDGCRIGTEARPLIEIDRHNGTGVTYQGGLDGAFHGSRSAGETTQGRWPAHVVLDEEAAAVLDAQSGIKAHKPQRVTRGKSALGMMNDDGWQPSGHTINNRGDTGGASRFFYVAKGSRAEKDAGLDHLPKRSGGEATDREDGSAGLDNPRAGAGRTGGARNFHPTVKSIALMRWLVRLITPPGGVVLDPFAGSGTTGVAALAEGMSFIGVEFDAEYHPITIGRLQHAEKGAA